MWPPRKLGSSEINKVVFVAGGVGINPLMSMLRFIAENSPAGLDIRLLYTVHYPNRQVKPSEILFLDRLALIFSQLQKPDSLQLFLTGRKWEEEAEGSVGGEGLMLRLNDGCKVDLMERRITGDDLESALGEGRERGGTAVYVCGVPGMTDWIVDFMERAEGMSAERVFCEKWW